MRAILARQPGARVLEPFSGTGTTALCAAEFGQEAWAFDINSFLIWLGRAKVATYSQAQVAGARIAAAELAGAIRGGAAPELEPPSLRNIGRWWSARRLRLLGALKAGIDAHDDYAERTLLLVAFCRTLMALSNAAFDHPSMSFALEAAEPATLDDDLAQFSADVEVVLSGCDRPAPGVAHIELGDARCLDRLLPEQAGRFDVLVTSPPYPNRMSYVRELRPYLYWFGYLQQAREAGELDWLAIGGTWGVATSRLAEWHPARRLRADLATLLDAIRAQPGSGPLMATYVQKYFEDMSQHLVAAQPLIARGGSVHYIVGNSSFYGITVPTEELLARELAELGFRHVAVERVRKRNSKKELFEFCVSAQR